MCSPVLKHKLRLVFIFLINLTENVEVLCVRYMLSLRLPANPGPENSPVLCGIPQSRMSEPHPEPQGAYQHPGG